MSPPADQKAPPGRSSTGRLLGAWLLLGLLTLAPGAVLVDTAERLRDQHGAAHGTYGIPGTTTITHRTPGGRGGGVCRGSFRPSRSGPVRTDLTVRPAGGCTRGRTLPARLILGDGGGWINSDDGDEAWALGTGAWKGTATITALFGFLALLFGAPWALISLQLVLRLLTPRGRQR